MNTSKTRFFLYHLALILTLTLGCTEETPDAKYSLPGESCAKSQDCEGESRCIQNVCRDEDEDDRLEETPDESSTEAESEPEDTPDEATQPPRGFLFVDGGKIDVPFPVVHTLFNFEEAMQTAKSHREVCGGKTKKKRRRSDCGHERWFGLVDLDRAPDPPYMEPRSPHPVRQVILHSTRTTSVPAAIHSLVGTGVSTHLIIDAEGLVYQLADLSMITFHAGEWNKTSIGVDLVHPLPALHRHGEKWKKFSVFPKEPHLEKLTLRRPIVTFNLRGRLLRSKRLTSPQQTTHTKCTHIPSVTAGEK